VSIGILVAGWAAAVGLVAVGRAGSGRRRTGAVSVAQLRARLAAAGETAADAADRGTDTPPHGSHEA
jgi:hypothetical protein